MGPDETRHHGEVGISVLLVSLEVFRQQGVLNAPGVQESMALAALSLALNLALTGLFILAVINYSNARDSKIHKSVRI